MRGFYRVSCCAKPFYRAPCYDELTNAIAVSSHRCCAERKLLQNYVEAARRKGIPAHSVVTWVRRKLGPDVLILRRRADGTLGCSAPCIFCQRELLRFDLRVHCSLAEGGFFSGRLSDSGAPRSGLSKAQKGMLKK